MQSSFHHHLEKYLHSGGKRPLQTVKCWITPGHASLHSHLLVFPYIILGFSCMEHLRLPNVSCSSWSICVWHPLHHLRCSLSMGLNKSLGSIFLHQAFLKCSTKSTNHIYYFLSLYITFICFHFFLSSKSVSSSRIGTV